MIAAVVHHPYFFGAMRIGMWLRVASSGLVYRKMLRLNQEALVSTTAGQIVNLLTNDVQRFDNAVLFLHFVWAAPLQAIAAFLLLWQRLGMATLAGFLVLVMLIPVQMWMGRLFAMLRRRTALLTDERVKFMSEMLNGMRVIKLYCWEDFFRRQVKRVRR